MSQTDAEKKPKQNPGESQKNRQISSKAGKETSWRRKANEMRKEGIEMRMLTDDRKENEKWWWREELWK